MGEQQKAITAIDAFSCYRRYFSHFKQDGSCTLSDIRKAEQQSWSALTFNFKQAIDIVLACVNQLDKLFAEEIYQAFSQGRIKTSTTDQDCSFCIDTAKGAFICLPFDGGLSDLALLAHECGHLVHQQAIRRQCVLAQTIDIELSEAIAIFFETWVIKQWAALTNNLTIATAWQQHQDIEWQGRHQMLAAFELALYRLMPLTRIEIDHLWQLKNQQFYGAAVDLNTDMQRGWLELHHILNAPFYFLAYPSASRKSKEFMKEPSIIVNELLSMYLCHSDDRSNKQIKYKYKASIS